ncbi:MAG: ATP-binding protein [Gemmatimonas sp.]
MPSLSTAPETAVTLTLLGAFGLTRSDGTIVLPPGKPLALLAYLVCSRNRRASRSVVAELLWGDSAEAPRRASLRQVLFTVRNTLGASGVVSDGEWLEAGAHIVTDVDTFLLAIEAKQYAAAVQAYAGEFVPSFASPGAAEFERWADTERRRLRGAFLAAAVQQLRDLIQQGNTGQALPLTARLVEVAPDDDEMWRRRFDVLSLAGEGGQMLLEIASLRATRADEGVALDPSLERHLGRLVGALARHASETEQGRDTGGVPAVPEFQGRTAEFTALLAAWAAATGGVPQRCLVIGAPGMGKSRLLRELTTRVKQRRVQVVLVAAQQRERDDAYAVLAELVSQLVGLPGAAGMAPSSAAVLAVLVPRIAEAFAVAAEHAPAGTDLLLRHLRALADLIGAVSEENPLLILLDDMHWADAASIKTIDFALRRVTAASVLLVGTSRHDVPELGCGGAEIVLRPLDQSEVQALIVSIAEVAGDASSRALVEFIHPAAHGSPFEVLQLLRTAVSRDILRIVDRTWVVVSEQALDDLCHEARSPQVRLGDISDAEREVLSLLAALDAPMDESLLLGLLDDTSGRATITLGNLERDGLAARDTRRRWSIAHALIADDIRATTPLGQPQQSAQRLGAALLIGARALPDVRRAVRLLLEGRDPEAALKGAVRWYAAQGTAAPSVEEFVLALRGAQQHVEFEQALRRQLRWRRAWWRQPTVVAMASVVATLAVTIWYLTTPARLVLSSEMNPAAMIDAEVPFEVPPRVEVHNRLGRISRARDGDTLRIVTDSGSKLWGRTTAVLRDGVAEFDSLYPPLLGVSGTMRVQLPGLRPLILPTPPSREELRVMDFLLNGKLVRSAVGTVQVQPGDSITGNVRLRYTTRGRSLLYVLAQTTSWGVPSADTTTVRSLLAGVVGARAVVPIALVAPEREGTYWILFAQNAEPAAVWLLSGTNWRCQQPRWDDGNDIAAQPEATLLRSVVRGEIPLSFEYCDESRYREVRPIPLAGIRVEVRR